ncbi:MAG: polyprenyl diphosphate synthase [Steroidobacteraceae bacterium]|jgi:undecaprenyl diphosphate synthase|nr:polyprenyl diphosphate synthase [Steroidobacteraceae bacterium]
MAFEPNPPVDPPRPGGVGAARAPAGVPRHVAIIMDGNGRWAATRRLPRSAGHRAGIRPVRMSVEECAKRGVEVLTLFAFSSENWRRPPQEVGLLMQLFLEAIEREVDELSRNGVELRFIGERGSLAEELRLRMANAEARTRGNRGLKLVVAVAYGGRWDLVQAARRLARECADGRLAPEAIDEARIGAALALGDLPEPDLFIRTGGDRRVSNFLLWNLAYTELCFVDALWPEFSAEHLGAAFASFAARQRRFGMTGEQVEAGPC